MCPNEGIEACIGILVGRGADFSQYLDQLITSTVTAISDMTIMYSSQAILENLIRYFCYFDSAPEVDTFFF